MALAPFGPGLASRWPPRVRLHTKGEHALARSVFAVQVLHQDGRRHLRVGEGAFIPVAVVLRSVPFVAMTPLIAVALGRGLVSVTVIAGIVTFFPTLVNVVQGLRSAPDDAILLMRAFDASELTTLVKVRLPSALPSLFSSARIAAPGALLGAILAEWLSTGTGSAT